MNESTARAGRVSKDELGEHRQADRHEAIKKSAERRLEEWLGRSCAAIWTAAWDVLRWLWDRDNVDCEEIWRAQESRSHVGKISWYGSNLDYSRRMQYRQRWLGSATWICSIAIGTSRRRWNRCGNGAERSPTKARVQSIGG
jgi:hypothetical protein